MAQEDGRAGGPEGAAESTLQKPPIDYPTAYTFKVMGTQEGFRDYVLALFERLMGQPLAPDAVAEQPSSKGKYLSLSVTVRLDSEEQRKGIYGELYKEKRVVYYL